ncbi:F-box protein [Striga asiatica]|uniref:F-box protein n=1 Tax=Striga asiatica TaxID=4170 RepID=A0A5A7QEA1_STRAF|nr:F-box protein [Striga asiatica]
MNSNTNHFKSLPQDLVLDIMSRLDGPTLAAIGSSSTNLRLASKNEKLWQKLCHETWPSTSNTQIPSRKNRGFKSFYADAFPLILHSAKTGLPRRVVSLDSTNFSPSDFISFIDIYHEGQCIFSKVVHHENNNTFEMLLCYYPFKLEVLGKNILTTKIPSTDYLNHEEDKFVESLRLSWILFDVRKGNSSNISSWRPRSIQKFNSSVNKLYVISFGCVVKMDGNELLTCYTSVEFVITVKCRVLIEKGCIIIRWKEISLVIKDVNGSHLNGEQSMRAMKQAFVCSRSVNHHIVESKYQEFSERKMELKQKNEQRENLANLFCAIIAIATLLGIGYSCAALL